MINHPKRRRNGRSRNDVKAGHTSHSPGKDRKQEPWERRQRNHVGFGLVSNNHKSNRII
ncbi:unnamed protein product [Spirodela intermedia]|uniref:Uncharacterized protein n=1 Tax=Spirodela intermedia TaxID=51605 RepID=A0A7I8IQU9_SPIIN|nr:unnamed protein product [Spirodela intermedia]CAA6660162.1 unnamed protein product [Spirodela intermedia]